MRDAFNLSYFKTLCRRQLNQKMYELDYVYVHLIILGYGEVGGGGGEAHFLVPPNFKKREENVVHKRTNASDLSSLAQLPRSTPNTL